MRMRYGSGLTLGCAVLGTAGAGSQTPQHKHQGGVRTSIRDRCRTQHFFLWMRYAIFSITSTPSHSLLVLSILRLHTLILYPFITSETLRRLDPKISTNLACPTIYVSQFAEFRPLDIMPLLPSDLDDWARLPSSQLKNRDLFEKTLCSSRSGFQRCRSASSVPYTRDAVPDCGMTWQLAASADHARDQNHQIVQISCRGCH